MKFIFKLLILFLISNHSYAETFICKMDLERYGQKGTEKKFYQRKGNKFVNHRDWNFVITDETKNYVKLEYVSEIKLLPSIFAVLIDKRTNEFTEIFSSITEAKKNIPTKPAYGTCEVIR